MRVLLSTGGPDGTTKFVDQVVSSPAAADFIFFSWRAAVFSRYDVFHVHWPETLVRARSRRRALVRPFQVMALLFRLSLCRTAVVRTVHNESPHSPGGRWETFVLGLLDRLVDVYVVLNPVTRTRAAVGRLQVSHGSYREPFAMYPLHERTRDILFFGRVQAYKGIDQLIAAFRDCGHLPYTLSIVGSPDPRSRSGLLEHQRADPRIQLDLAFVGDEELVGYVGRSSLVVLPYERMHNSGVLLVALSLNRPVLAPWSEVNAWVRDEVGPDWLRLYEGDLDGPTLDGAVAWAEGERAAVSPLSPERSWSKVAEGHRRAYELSLSRSRRQRR